MNRVEEKNLFSGKAVKSLTALFIQYSLILRLKGLFTPGWDSISVCRHIKHLLGIVKQSRDSGVSEFAVTPLNI